VEKLVITHHFDKANVLIFDIGNINTYAKVLKSCAGIACLETKHDKKAPGSP
jgi:hypothetical protein